MASVIQNPRALWGKPEYACEVRLVRENLLANRQQRLAREGKIGRPLPGRKSRPPFVITLVLLYQTNRRRSSESFTQSLAYRKMQKTPTISHL